jgi:hypothetical protein
MGELQGKRIAFIVHSGFPEPLHSEHTLAWLKRVAVRLGMVCVGGAIKGGSEGARIMPPNMTTKLGSSLAKLGAELVRDGSFGEEAVKELAGKRKYNPLVLALFSLAPSPLKNMYWGMMLRKHKAWDRRFDRPYLEAASALRAAGATR